MADILNTIETDRVLKIGEDFSSTLSDKDGFDEDYIRLESLSSSKIYKFTIDTDTLNSVIIFDSKGDLVLDTYNDPNQFNVLYFYPQIDGDYYLDVYGTSGDYTISSEIEPAVNDAIPNTIETAPLLSNVDVDDMRIDEVYDLDIFKVNLEDGKSYDLNFSADDLNDYFINLVDENGYEHINDINIVYDFENDDYDMVITPSETGSYYIKINGKVGKYNLSVEETVYEDGFDGEDEEIIYFNGDNSDNNDDHPDDIYGDFTNSVIKVDGSSVEGSLETEYDEDYFKLDVEKGDIVDITISSDNENFLPYLNIVDSEGYYIWDNIDYIWSDSLTDKEKEHLIFRVSDDKDYLLKVDGYPTGDYTINAKSLNIEDDHANTISEITDRDVLNSGTITASLETEYDEDYFKIDVKAGEIYVIDTNTYDVNLQLVDRNGDYLWGDEVTWNWTDNGEEVIYLADKDSELYLKVDSWKSVDNYNITLTKEEIVVDDVVNTIEEARYSESLPVNGQEINATLNNVYDVDMFKLDMEAGHSYIVELQSNSWPFIDVFDDNGYYAWSDIEWQFDNDDVAKLLITPVEDETYYLGISGYESSDYKLKVTDTSLITIEDDYSDNIFTNGELAVNSMISGELETLGDIDWIKVNLNKGEIYQIDVTSNNLDVIIDGVYDSNGNYILNSWDDDSGFGVNAQTEIVADYTGDYYISIDGYGIGDYNVSVTKTIVNDKETDDISTIAKVEVNNMPYIGNIDYYQDVDWVKVDLEEGVSYQVDLIGDTLSDTVINGIYDSEGNLLPNTFNDDNGFSVNSEVNFTASQSGSYFISVSGYGDNVGSYNLSVKTSNDTQLPIDSFTNDTNDTMNTAIDLNIDTYTDGTIDYIGDRDLFKVHLDSNKKYDISMLGSSSINGTLIDPQIEGIYDSNGNLINLDYENIDNNGIGYDSSLLFSPDNSGDFYIQASGNNDSVGTYKIKVKEEKNDEVNIEPITTNKEDGSWTIMVYLAADNNLEEAALQDINEMEAANLPDNVNITFLLDRAEGYSTADGDWTGTKQGVIQSDNDMYSISSPMEDLDELNTGDGQTLTNFIDWSVETAEADNYALVVWNHGGGVEGVAWDEGSNSDNLSLNELTSAINSSKINHFDMIGFDTCLQGVLDQSYALKEKADVIVSSENTEPGNGWDYTGWLNNLNQSNIDGTITTDEMAVDVVNSYGNFYDGEEGTTLSAIRTNKIDNLVSSLEDFNEALSLLTNREKGEFKTKLDSVKHYNAFNDYVDLASLAQMADSIDATTNKDADGKTFDDYAQNLYLAIHSEDDNDAILASYSDDGKGEGVTIYLPGYMEQDYLDNYKLAQETNMDDLFQLVS